MNHIDFLQTEINRTTNPVQARVHLETLHAMPIDDAKKSLCLYMEYILKKETDLKILNNFQEK